MNQEPTLTVHANGDKRWFLHGKLHREDGAAIEHASGTKAWYLHGKLHRVDGAAVEWANGTKEWFLHGELHREDGAAVEYADGDKEWWLHNKSYATAASWAEALLKQRNEPHDDASVDAFLKTIFKKNAEEAL